MPTRSLDLYATSTPVEVTRSGMHPLTHSDFIDRAVVAFPELGEDVAELAAMPRLQISAIAQRLQRAKGAADWDAYERGIRLVQDSLATADEQLSAELRHSFMKALDFDGERGPIAWAYLSPELQHAWKAVHAELDRLTALPHRAASRKR
jgi:hypothetical protein